MKPIFLFGAFAIAVSTAAHSEDRIAWEGLFSLPNAISETATSPDEIQNLPTSFRYGGAPSSKLLANWSFRTTEPKRTDGTTSFSCVWAAPDGFEARLNVVHFDEPAAVETQWVFTNLGTEPSERITDAFAIDLSASSEKERCVLHSAMGGITGTIKPAPESAGFELAATPLGEKALTVSDGRSSNGHLPFFCLEHFSGERGVVGALGWSGQWEARGAFDASTNRVTFYAGMTPVGFRLPPGETVRMPRALLVPFEGDARVGTNRLRRLLREHYQGRIDGERVLSPVSFNTWFVFNNDVNAAMLMELAGEAAPLGIEYFCLDAGWFDGDFPKGVGNWTVNREKFPDGLEAEANRVHDLGMKFGLWFEPERVTEGTRWATEHGDLLYEARAAGDRRLLDLSKPEARRLIVDMISGYVDRLGVDWIRYDFNISPLGFWKAAEGPDEQGLAQLRYINGLYAVLDELMQRHPGLLIEQCASGGRRIDLETIRYGHTFWKSDDTFDQLLMRFHETGGNEFLLAGHLNTNYCTFASAGEVLALFAGPLGFGADFRTLTDEQKAFLKRATAAYKDIRQYLNADYYPAFPQTKDPAAWNGWQFVAPETGEGVVIAYRPETATDERRVVPLKGLKPGTDYRLREAMTGEERVVSSQDVAAGIELTLAPGTCEVWRYRPE